jgi:hypothetical protein
VDAAASETGGRFEGARAAADCARCCASAMTSSLSSACAFRLCDVMLMGRAPLSFACAPINGGQRKGMTPRAGVDGQRVMPSLRVCEGKRQTQPSVLAVRTVESDESKRGVDVCFVRNELRRSASGCSNATHKQECT